MIIDLQRNGGAWHGALQDHPRPGSRSGALDRHHRFSEGVNRRGNSRRADRNLPITSSHLLFHNGEKDCLGSEHGLCGGEGKGVEEEQYCRSKFRLAHFVRRTITILPLLAFTFTRYLAPRLRAVKL